MTNGTVQNVYNTANITGTGSHAGGIVGYLSKGTIQYIYNTGTIVGNNYVGGLVGYTYGNSTTYYNTVTFGYNSATVGGKSYYGGCIGANPETLPAAIPDHISITILPQL
jgi:hypothetical protein